MEKYYVNRAPLKKFIDAMLEEMTAKSGGGSEDGGKADSSRCCGEV